MRRRGARSPALPVAALVQAAREARRRAHAPYSRFRVGAAVATESGAVVTGCNVENASFGLSVCAERVAIQRAVAQGHRRLVAVAVAADRSAVMPCGACRQVMAEFGVRTVVVAGPRGNPLVFPLSDLLTHPFGGADLRRRKPRTAGLSVY